ncbi:HlyD family secretion protein [Sphingobium subterraneum]|uniref:HlyD family secretion protein n=1 Tax=Sphingobium subterraneum TaxID=627688 RepID=A0A841J3N3_9SPHN|nr:HlyD family efflux transporter periplasmic adaptor subunit [Sphingobium subterraneum]MBB6122871.1 HlyD family secretion protein [Sphingobium subterraneum]
MFLVLAGCEQRMPANSHIGYVEVEWVYVAAPLAGWIVSRPVAAGSKVLKGDVLFTLDDSSQLAASNAARSKVVQAEAQERDISTGARVPEIRAIEAQIDQARAQLRLTRLQNERIGKLANDGFASKQQRDQAEAAFRSAEAQVRQFEEQIVVARQAGRPAAREVAQAGVDAARAASSSATYNLDQRVIRAGVGGEVSMTFLNPGEYAASANPVLALLPANSLKVHMFVTEAELPVYRVGTRVLVRSDSMEKAVEGRISFVAPNAEFTPPVIYSQDVRARLVFLVKVDVPDTRGLLPGLPVDVTRP